MSNGGGFEKFIDSIFSIKKRTLLLILIFLIGFVLRFIAATNLSVSADDMHHVVHAIDFYSAGRLEPYDQSSGLWHAFTSKIYDFFGTTQLTSRSAALIFGSFSIIVIYFLTREFFNEKVAMLSAFLLAISPFLINITLAEMDPMAMFFVLLGMLFFIRALKTNKTKTFALSGLFIGLGVYTKVYPFLFVPSLLLYAAYFQKKSKKQVFTKENIKKILVFLLLVFVFAVPTLTHNYLLYKDKGFMDFLFTDTFGYGKEVSRKYYSFDAGYEAPSRWNALVFGDEKYRNGTPLLWITFSYTLFSNPINFFLAVLGVVIIFYKKRNKDYLVFYLLSIMFVWFVITNSLTMSKHFIFLEILIMPLSALGAFAVIDKTSKLFKKNISLIILLLLLVQSLYFLGIPKVAGAHFYGKSHIAQMMEFKEDNIANNALIVGDSRIYRGEINWAFQGRPYFEGSAFMQILNQQEEIPGNVISVDVYYFECILDDCGWGTVKNQPEFNASMESLTDFFVQNGQLVKTISAPDVRYPLIPIIESDNTREVINIYSAKLQIKEQVIILANQPKNWFLYDIGFKPKQNQFDYYRTFGFFDTLLDKIAHWIVTLALVLAFLSPLYVIYLLFTET